MQPLLSCTKETNVCSQDMYDTLLPLFTGGQSNVEPNEACIQPVQVSNPIRFSYIDFNLTKALSNSSFWS